MKEKEIKKIYNTQVKNKYNGNYEYGRWFSSKIAEGGYEMTKRSIEQHSLFLDSEVIHYIELGSGPGTWTKLFLEKCKNETSFDLVDISCEMLESAKENLAKYKNIQFFEKNFMEFSSDNLYDFFFSSRAIEYFPDKNTLVKKISTLLKSNATGFIITKTPKYKINKILGKNTSDFHSGQISPKELAQLLVDNGFNVLEIHPVTLSFPIFKSVFLNMILFRLFSSFRLNSISQFFSESYCISFIKK